MVAQVATIYSSPKFDRNEFLKTRSQRYFVSERLRFFDILGIFGLVDVLHFDRLHFHFLILIGHKYELQRAERETAQETEKEDS